MDIPFNSDAKNLVIGDTNGFTDVFVHDTCAGANVPCLPSTVIVSIKLDGTQGNFNSAIPTISADGHFVTFVGGFEESVNPLDPSKSRSLSLFDARHRFVFSNYWQIPKAPVTNWSRHVINGWESSSILTIQAGFPIRLTSTSDHELMNRR